jgi:hypothetical protein
MAISTASAHLLGASLAPRSWFTHLHPWTNVPESPASDAALRAPCEQSKSRNAQQTEAYAARSGDG